MSPPGLRVGLSLLVLAAACSREHAPSEEHRAPVAPAIPRDAAGPSTPGDSAVDAVPAGARAAVDLLHTTDAALAVASVVANPAISPFDLVDGDLTTAWNSRTGDGHAWIAFRVPPSTHVERVRMTAGFTATGPEGDYFMMNLRIRKVRMWHDGISLREVELDPGRRDLQDIPVDANGGEYKLEVVLGR